MSARASVTRAAAEPLAAGAEIAAGYRVIAHLRRGNDLDVYDAWSEERGARCIAKALRPDRLAKRRTRKALLREGALLQRLTHPHIVRAYETVEKPVPVVILETLSGQTLAHMIAEDPEGGDSDVAHLGLQLGSAVRYLHRNGILHLDLKPSNVIALAGIARLLDLSLARPPGVAHAGIGTWHYLSPEQARGGHLSAAADVWGLGAVLFETAAGEAPFDDDPDAWEPAASDSGTYSEAAPDRYPQLERRARSLATVAETAPELTRLIDACLEPDPADRPSIEELMAGLEPHAGLPPAERRWAAPPR